MTKLSRREHNKIRCRQEILMASRQLFREKGYEGAMIEEIAERARVSKATLYNYFPNKESLLLGNALEVLDQVGGLLEQRREESGWALLRAALRSIVLSALEYPELSRRIFYHNAFPDNPLYCTRVETVRLFCALAEAAREDGSLRADAELDEVVDLLMGVFLTALFHWDAGRDGPDLALRLDRLLERSLSAYLA